MTCTTCIYVWTAAGNSFASITAQYHNFLPMMVGTLATACGSGHIAYSREYCHAQYAQRLNPKVFHDKTGSLLLIMVTPRKAAEILQAFHVWWRVAR